MKHYSLLALALFSLQLTSTFAQTEAPKGYKQGSIMLTDGTKLNGWVKDNMRGNAAIGFVREGTTGKKNYAGSDLRSVEIENARFVCIHGDFFKLLCEGKLCFLQKNSDASGKPTYNGNEAIFSNGTDGRLNDYFIYDGNNGQLTLLTRKNLAAIAANCFAGHSAAIEKARGVEGDLSQVQAAVELFNAESK